MKPLVDTTKFRGAIKQAFAKAAKADQTPKFQEGEGAQVVPADDKELLGEATAEPHTVKHWAGWIYQKRADGKWDKLVPSPKRNARKKER